MLYIRLSDLRKTNNKDGALEKNVDYQFEFPRQCIVQKNALSLTQAPMAITVVELCFAASSLRRKLSHNSLRATSVKVSMAAVVTCRCIS